MMKINVKNRMTMIGICALVVVAVYFIGYAIGTCCAHVF